MHKVGDVQTSDRHIRTGRAASLGILQRTFCPSYLMSSHPKRSPGSDISNPSVDLCAWGRALWACTGKTRIAHPLGDKVRVWDAPEGQPPPDNVCGRPLIVILHPLNLRHRLSTGFSRARAISSQLPPLARAS